MVRFFLDTSVLFAAVYSPFGGAGRLVTDAINKQIELVISDDVAAELREVFAQDYPKLVESVESLLLSVPFVYVTITTAQRDEAAAVVADPDDAHIVAAAKISAAQALVTLDRKHLLNKPKVVAHCGMVVITPGEAISLYQE